MEPEGSKMELKVLKMEPKGSKMVPKGPQMESKYTKMEPKGLKMELKSDQNALKNRCPKKVGSRTLPGVGGTPFFITFWPKMVLQGRL